jgi:lysophospholipase L1-like esterase
MLAAYLIGLHMALVLCLWRPDWILRWRKACTNPTAAAEFPRFYEDMRRYYARSAAIVPEGSVFFIGDSHIQSLCVEAVVQPSVNYGIGGDTTAGVLNRLADYEFPRASAVVLCIGGNDLKDLSPEATADGVRRILSRIPPALPVVLSAVPAVDDSFRAMLHGTNSQISRLNNLLRVLAAVHPQVTWADQSSLSPGGALDPSLHDSDGAHLNAEGNRRFAANLAAALQKRPVTIH